MPVIVGETNIVDVAFQPLDDISECTTHFSDSMIEVSDQVDDIGESTTQNMHEAHYVQGKCHQIRYIIIF